MVKISPGIPSTFSQQTIEQLEVTEEVVLSEIDKLNDFTTQSAFTCSELTIETLEKGVKYVQS